MSTHLFMFSTEFRDYSEGIKRTLARDLGVSGNSSLTEAVCCVTLPQLGVKRWYCCPDDLYATITPDKYNRANLANSSSKGPSRDLRLKPEVVWSSLRRTHTSTLTR